MMWHDQTIYTAWTTPFFLFFLKWRSRVKILVIVRGPIERERPVGSLFVLNPPPVEDYVSVSYLGSAIIRAYCCVTAAATATAVETCRGDEGT